MINILSKDTIDKIAAGEVAENPESVVKELLDNSIDAGADTVSIELKNGGLDLIRVTDNGCGIAKSDVRKAFMRHATSKLKDAADIERVETLGFRGEALASIAAVSDVEMITKTGEELTGTQIRLSGGEEKLFREIGVPDGTTVVVRDFLKNVPVRRNFLKSPQLETSYVINTVEKAALAHPDVGISLITDGKTKLSSSGNGKLKELIYIIYGAETAASVRKVDYTGNAAGAAFPVRVRGYTAVPAFSKGRRDFEVFIVNGRCVMSDVLRKAAEDAYAPYLMQHKYPVLVLNIDIVPGDVDVNVHPKKSEVRFSDNKRIYDAVFEALSEFLKGSNLIKDASNAFLLREKPVRSAFERGSAKPPEPFETGRNSDRAGGLKERTETDSGVFSGGSGAFAFGTGEGNGGEGEKEDSLKGMKTAGFRLIGQVFDTYWLFEAGNEFYIMDQHAAHEKVNYEKFKKLIQSHAVERQMLYPPIILSLSGRESVLLDRCMDDFTEAGYEIEYAGDRDYIVRAVPSNLPELGDEAVLMSLIDGLFEEGEGLSSALIKDRIASMSCKAAIKGNRAISTAEAENLIKRLFRLENPYVCAHGRPTVIKFSRAEMEKMFKRIVN